MLELKTPLAGASFESEGISLRESPDFTLTLYAGSSVSLKREVGALPDFGTAHKEGKHTFFRAGPDQVLVLGEEIDTRLCAATPLSSARCRIEISGTKARTLLVACAAVDFSSNAFGTHAMALTGIHHMPVMIHALPDGKFHIYGLRTYAASLWEWLVDATTGLG